jgi:hypothetical protein
MVTFSCWQPLTQRSVKEGTLDPISKIRNGVFIWRLRTTLALTKGSKHEMPKVPGLKISWGLCSEMNTALFYM